MTELFKGYYEERILPGGFTLRLMGQKEQKYLRKYIFGNYTFSLIYFRYRNIIFPEAISMDFITTNQVAAKWGITDRQVRILCTSGKINGAKRAGRSWLIPTDAS
ncbi:MAG: hypothetical protein Q8920_15545, partial [Bacillota bacterium]|nr:hypothetical protein [Bacillota bacterium]